MLADMKADLQNQQQAALQEQVWLEPALPEMKHSAYPAYYPYPDKYELHKKDKEHMQYQPDMANMPRVRIRCLCIYFC